MSATVHYHRPITDTWNEGTLHILELDTGTPNPAILLDQNGHVVDYHTTDLVNLIVPLDENLQDFLIAAVTAGYAVCDRPA